MGKITMEEASQLRQEFNQALKEHKDDQKEVIAALVKSVEKVGENIEKLTDTVSRMETLQVEVNNVNRRVDQMDESLRSTAKEQAEQGKKLAVADNFVSSITRMQYTIWGALILAVVFAAFQVTK